MYRSQDSYCVTERQLPRIGFIEIGEQLKSMCCNGKAMWTSLTHLPWLHSSSLLSTHREENGRSCSLPITRYSGRDLVLLSPHLSSLRIDQFCCISQEIPKWHPGATLPLMYAGKWQLLSQILSLRTLQPWTVHCHRQQLLARLSKYFSFACFILIFISFSSLCGPSRKPN